MVLALTFIAQKSDPLFAPQYKVAWEYGSECANKPAERHLQVKTEYYGFTCSLGMSPQLYVVDEHGKRGQASPNSEDAAAITAKGLKELDNKINAAARAGGFTIKRRILVVDNASWHNNATFNNMVKSCGYERLEIPPYSSDFNVQEEVWRSVNNIVDGQHDIDDWSILRIRIKQAYTDVVGGPKGRRLMARCSPEALLARFEELAKAGGKRAPRY